jgi:hypothetical protein
MPEPTIVIEGLSEFRAALRAAEEATPRELTAALKAAGLPIVQRAAYFAPKRTGQLAASYKASATGTRAQIVSKVPYGAGAEWGTHGKWAGFKKYRGAPDSGDRGRFVWRALLELSDEVMDDIANRLEEILTIHGWAT